MHIEEEKCIYEFLDLDSERLKLNFALFPMSLKHF